MIVPLTIREAASVRIWAARSRAGRLDLRRGAVAAISPVNAGLPEACSAITVQRDWSEKKDPQPTPKSHTRFFLASFSERKKKRAADAVRGHWAVENRNHHKRDASAWQEDRHRHRKPNAALNLALSRNVLLAMLPFEQGQPLAHFFEQYHRQCPATHPQRPPNSMSLPAKRPGPAPRIGAAAINSPRLRRSADWLLRNAWKQASPWRTAGWLCVAGGY